MAGGPTTSDEQLERRDGRVGRPYADNADERRLDSVERALDLCDRALDLMDELQRTDTLDPKPHFQEAVAAVQAVRTELTTMRR